MAVLQPAGLMHYIFEVGFSFSPLEPISACCHCILYEMHHAGAGIFDQHLENEMREGERKGSRVRRKKSKKFKLEKKIHIIRNSIYSNHLTFQGEERQRQQSKS